LWLGPLRRPILHHNINSSPYSFLARLHLQSGFFVAFVGLN